MRDPVSDHYIVRNVWDELGVEPHDDFLLQTCEGCDKGLSDLGRKVLCTESGATEAEENNSVIS